MIRTSTVAASLAGLIALTILPLATSTQALCSYKDVLYAKTTVEEEFHDSKWVAKIKVQSALNSPEDQDAPWVLYHLKVLTSFKGTPAHVVKFYTERNSGAFYFDRPWAGANIGGEYLVFLNPNPPGRENPSVATGTVFVNYACGQSKPWKEVSAAELKTLKRLAAKPIRH